MKRTEFTPTAVLNKNPSNIGSFNLNNPTKIARKTSKIYNNNNFYRQEGSAVSIEPKNLE